MLKWKEFHLYSNANNFTVNIKRCRGRHKELPIWKSSFFDDLKLLSLIPVFRALQRSSPRVGPAFLGGNFQVLGSRPVRGGGVSILTCEAHSVPGALPCSNQSAPEAVTDAGEAGGQGCSCLEPRDKPESEPGRPATARQRRRELAAETAGRREAS